MLVTGLGAAIFEGGTLGILALAVSVLTGEGQNIPLEIPRIVDDEVSLFLETTSRGGVFLTIVGIAWFRLINSEISALKVLVI